jgi:hypothetical protein
MNINLIIFIKHDDSIKDRQKIINYYNNAYNLIEEKIKTFANFQTITHTQGTNVVSLSANWKRENLRPFIKRILKIREVDSLFAFPNYREELNDAIEMGDFFKVVAFASTLLESYGKEILIKYYETKYKDRDHHRIYDLSFYATTTMLYSSGIIDKALFDEINYVRKGRNKLIHKTYDLNLPSVLSTKEVKNMENLAHIAIHSASKLIVKDLEAARKSLEKDL